MTRVAPPARHAGGGEGPPGPYRDGNESRSGEFEFFSWANHVLSYDTGQLKTDNFRTGRSPESPHEPRGILRFAPDDIPEKAGFQRCPEV